MAHKYRTRVDTKQEIIKVGTKMFLEDGFTKTTVAKIAKELDISPGNLTFHFPTKEHLLSVLVDELCQFQWKVIERYVEDGKTSLLAVCLEFSAMVAVCEENEIVKDFFISSYNQPMTLEIIRKNDAEKAKKIFGIYCKDWKDEHYEEAETLVSGIEYATLMTTESSQNLEVRIAGALNAIMSIYNVPEEIRKIKIHKVLTIDYKETGRKILKEFFEYISEKSIKLVAI